ncbi:EAL domain-containing protein [Acetobacterium tundrae]|uniref:EAL domain-containing protein n=1 Tax=Acetobacterium tundrae TaxID=132932 RepID=A0ABR6WI26_9FIRM|nr:EAL domain-containing protein [Acetobacterium tundrae]MBC3796142.1 EAL domain-containing protein [Acetobacterium tundrae]
MVTISTSTFFSLIFYFSFMAYLYFGFYILKNDDVPMRKWIFFALCITLSIWAFGFSMANSAPDYDTALFWRRFSALGWGSMYSFLLHFILILTNRTKWLRKKWLTILIYLPMLINIIAFSLYNPIATNQYNLHYSPYGWINQSINNSWDLFFNVYYITYTLFSIGLIIIWGLKSDKKGRMSALLLFLTISIALILGSATDILLNTYITSTAPQMAPVIILIPIGAIFYSIRHYDLMKPDITISATSEGEILNNVNYTQIYKFLSFFYLIGGGLDFAASYFIFHVNFGSTLLFSAFLCSLGLALIGLNHSPIQAKNKDLIMVYILALTVPILAFKYINYTFITIWAAPVIFIILLIPFRNGPYLRIFGTIILSTMALVSIKIPSITIHMDMLDHLMHFLLVFLFLAMAFYVNRIFLQRLEENERQVRFQKMVSQISSDLITSNQLNYQEKVQNLLKLCGKQYQVDRSYLCLFSADMKTISYAYEWCNDGIEPSVGKVETIHTSAVPWFVSQISNNSNLYIPNLETLPPEAITEKALLQSHQIKSVLSIPVITNDQILGFLGFDSMENPHVWGEDSPDLLIVISNILADALAKINAEKEISYLAFYDALTGLPNRTLFRDRLTEAIYSAQRAETFIGIIFLDLDAFKSVNDTMGHNAGDELLIKVAQRLTGCVRKQDTVCRFGGDEYLIMLPNITVGNDIPQMSEMIMNSFKNPFKIKNQEFFITASAGVALYPIDGDEPDMLIKNADLAMYTSKDQGKNKYTLCSPLLKEDIQLKMKLTNALYRALERHELVLYYQPQLSVETNTIIGIEALIRWNHPELGLILPETFIPLAEQHSSLIGPIGEWLLMTACKQNKIWHSMGIPPFRMAVSLSGEQFLNSNLLSTIKQVIIETGIPPETLELEITESIALKGKVNVMNELRVMGITIAIDHFGIEYSSLNRLKTLPIDRIKMDPAFVHGIGNKTKDEAIAKIIIQLANNLGLAVIAEGVETESQLAFLKAEHCDEVQGFYFYNPMTADEISSILLQR